MYGSQEDFQLFEATPGKRVVFLPDPPTFTIIAVSKDMCEFIGCTKEQVVGKSVFEAFPANPADVEATGHKNLRDSLEYVVRHKAGHKMDKQRYDVATEGGPFKEIYWQNTSTPVLNEAEAVSCIIHTAEDITEKVKAGELQERLKGMEQAYRLFMQAPFAIHIFTGPELLIELANPPTLELWGKEDDVTGKRFLDVLPELKDQGYDALMQEVMQTGIAKFFYEVPLALDRPGKEPIGYFNFMYQPYYKEGVATAESVLIIANEVTQQVLARKQALKTEQSLSLAVEIAELGVFNVDLKTGTATYARRVADWFGLRQMVLPLNDVLSRIHSEDRPMVAATLERSIAGAWKGRHDMVYRVAHPQTGTVQYLRSIGQVGFEDGIAVSISGIIQDETEQALARHRVEELVAERTRELAEANEALVTVNRELQRSNANLEEFAHAASHDLKEPIRKIQFFTDRLKNQLTGACRPEDETMFGRIESATQRMGALIDDLLLYSHVSQRPHQTASIDLNIKVQQVLEDLELDIRERGAVINAGKLPVVKGFQRQLQQLFQNLISNALKYSKADMPPRIEVKADEWEENGRRYHMISVKDNGIGFDQQYAEKIFQMFARLHSKSEYSGTGVGLSIVKKVVENHDGFIRVESAMGEGSVFKIYLPV